MLKVKIVLLLLFFFASSFISEGKLKDSFIKVENGQFICDGKPYY